MTFVSLAAGAFAFGLSWLVTLLVINFAVSLGLLSVPNHRSSHVKVTPHGGGLGIYIAVVLMSAVWLFYPDLHAYRVLYWYVLALASLIAITGLWDDIRQVPRKIRFFIQLFSCAVLVFLVVLPSILQQSASFFTGVILLVLVVLGVWWINLFNFMDGIDGLAAAQAIFMLSGGLVLMAMVESGLDDSGIGLSMVILVAASAGFLIHNWSPARIFMGDVGSTFLAFMILFFALVTSVEKELMYQTWLILGALFISDASVTLLQRFVSGQRWFEAHNSHAYQRLSRKYASHAKVSLGFVVVNLLWLFPLAWATLTYPAFSWYLVCLAYFPLLVCAWMVGAGMPDKKAMSC